MKRYIHYLLVSLFMLAAFAAEAQPTQLDFSTLITQNGCGIAEYKFDVTTLKDAGGVDLIASNYYYYWDFGNATNSGSPASNTVYQNNLRNYIAPGNYTVTLYVYAAPIAVPSALPALIVKSKVITVYTNPSPDFFADIVDVCLGDPITVTDNSNYAAQPFVGAVLSRRWNFGNGNLFDVTNPATNTFTYTYPNVGDYQVTLTTRTYGGRPGEECVTNRVRPAYIRVRHRPVAAFVINPTPSACSLPYAPTLTNNTTIASLPAPAGAITSYTWRFYNGPSNASPELPFSPITTVSPTAPVLPANAYTAAGTYAITLQATSSTGCTSTVTATQIFTIPPPTVADFSLPTATVICEGSSLGFIDTSTPGVQTYQWSFSGLGVTPTTSSAPNPIITYNAIGTNMPFSATLQVTYPNGCVRTITKNYTLTVNDLPDANFTNSPLNGFCQVPKAVTFTPLQASNPNYTYTWNFGQTLSPGLTGPIALGYIGTSTYSQFGVYNVALTVKDNITGCETTVTRVLTIEEPTTTFALKSPSTLNGCTRNVQFDISMNAIESIIKYEIDFDDDGTFDQTVNAPPTFHNPPVAANFAVNYNYTTRGTFIPKIRITTVNGCTFTQTGPTIRVGIPPVITGFTRTGGAGGNCQGGAGFTYTPIFQPGTGADVVLVSYGGATAIPYVPGVPFVFTANGSQSITYTASDNGCLAAPFTFSGGAGSQIDDPFPAISVNGGVPNICNGAANNQFCVNISASVPSPSPLTTSYEVDFGGTKYFSTDPGFNPANVCHTFTSPGTYTITVTALSSSGCSASRSTTVTAIDASTFVVDFNIVNPTPTCSFNTINLDASASTSSAPGVTITNYQWNFGDGQIQTTTTPTVSHTYLPSPTPYTVGLTVLFSNGCTKTYSGSAKTVNIQGPVPSITVSPTLNGCVGDTKNFAGSLASIIPMGNTIPAGGWTWNFGDPSSVGNIVNSQNASHIFANPGIYTVTLTVRDNNSLSSNAASGCLATTTVQVQIFPKPTVSFTAPPTTCVSNNTTFTSTVTGTGPFTYEWDFDGNLATVESTVPNPVYVFTSPASPGNANSQIITLKVTNANGCFNTFTRTVSVINPDFGISANGVVAPANLLLNCPPKTANFTATPIPANLDLTNWTFNWTFGDGNFVINVQNPSNIYDAPQAPGQFNVVLTATNSVTGCTIVKTLNNFITVDGPRGTFDFIPKYLCKPGVVVFSAGPFSGSPTKIRMDFGNGVTEQQTLTVGQTSATFSHNYTQSGSFLPIMTLEDASGCRVAYPSVGNTRVNVSGNPTANFTWTGGGQICKNITVNFTDQSTSDPGTPNISPLNPLIDATWKWQIFNADMGGVITGPAIATYTNVQNPAHIFTAAGNYVVRLAVETRFKNVDVPNGCPSTIDKVITIVEPTISATIANPTPSERCPGEPISFSGTGDSNVLPKIMVGTWSIYANDSGAPVTTPSTAGTLLTTFAATATPGAVAASPWNMAGNYVFSSTGYYTIELRVTDAALCTGGAVVTQVLKVDPLPTFAPASGPANQSICVTQAASFTVTPSATSLAAPGVTYRWQQNDGGGWVNVVDGPLAGILAPAIYSGATTDKLDITNGTFGMNGYQYRCIIKKANTSQCESTSTAATLTVNQNPTIADAGPAQNLCNLTSVTLAGNDVAPFSGKWTQVGGPALPLGSIVNDIIFNTQVNNLQIGIYTFRWTSSSGACASSSDDVVITNVRAANAGPNQALCAASTVTLTGNDPTIFGGTGSWSLQSGPAGSTITSPNTFSTTVTGLVPSVTPYVFRWTTTGPGCANGSTSDVTINNNVLPVVTGPASQTICAGQNATLNVGVSATVSYQWQVFDSGAGNFISLSNGAPYAGVTTPTLTITTPSVAFNGFRYRVLITNNTTACSDVTSEAILTVFPANTEVLSLATASPICIGSNVVASLSTTKVGYTYQLRVGVTPVAGVADIIGNGASQSFAAFAPIATATYNVLVTSPTANSVNCQQQLSSTINVVVNQLPSAAFAGPDKDVCGTSTTLSATAPAVGTGAWSVLIGPATIAPANLNNPNAPVTGLVNGTNTFRWTVTNGVCPPTFADVTITGKPVGTPANAGPDQTICSTVTTTGTLAGNNPGATGSGAWTVIAGGATVTSPSVFNSGVTNLATGVNTFRWTVLDLCTNVTTSDDITITLETPPTVPSVTAPINVCGTNNTTLAANTPMSGTGIWTVVAGTGLFTSATNPNTAVSGLSNGVNTFRWTISNTCGTNFADLNVTVSPVGAAANAGADQNICVATANLNGNTSVGTGAWTVIAGGGIIALADLNNPNAPVTGLTAGVNTFRWTITSPCGAVTSDDITINVRNPPTVALAGPDQNRCGVTTATMAANAVNAANGETGQWFITAGSGVFVNVNSPTSVVNGLSNGVNNTFEWRITNACGTTADPISITVSPLASVANAGTPQAICTTTTTLNAAIPTGGTGVWTSAAIAGSGVVATTNSATSNVTGLAPGVNTFRWTVTDACGTTTTSTVNITVQSPPTVATVGGNQSLCGTTVANLTANAVNAANGETGQWFVTAGSGVFAVATNPNTSVSGLANGVNTFEWRITNTCGTTVAPVTITVLPPLSAAVAGPDQSLCAANTLLGATAPINGTGRWSIRSITPAAPAPTIVDDTNPNSLITNLPAGSVTVLRWTVGNGGTCADIFDEVSITSNSNSVFAYAGPNAIQCGATVTLQANTPAVGTNFYWTLAPGTSVVTGSLGTPGGANGTPTLTVTGLALGSNVFSWTVGYIGAGCSSAISNVDITRIDDVPIVSAGTNQNICQTTPSTTLSGSTPTGTQIGNWTVTTQPAGANVTFVNATQANTVANGFTLAGNYTLRWTITNGTCASNSATVQIAVTAPPTTSNAGIAQTICADNTVLAATAVTVGQGSWSTVSVPSGAGTLTFSDINSPTASVSNLTVAGNYILKWTSKNAPCADSESTVTITRVTSPTVSNAGTPQSVCQTVASVTLAGNTPLVGSGLWTVAAPGGATVTFSNNTSPTANATGLTVAGVYTFTWTISNAPCLPNSTSTVQVTVTAPPTVSNAGIAQTICADNTVLAATAVTVGQGTWSTVSVPSGAGTLTFSDINSATASVSNLTVAGNYILKWTSKNAPCADSESTVTISRVASPTVSNAGTPQSVCQTVASVTLAGNTPLVGSGLWTVAAPGGATVTFSNNTSPTANATGLTVAGVYTFTWTISNAPCLPNSTSTVQVTVTAPPTVSNAGIAQTICADNTVLAATAVTVGQGTWSTVSVPSGAGTLTFSDINSATASVSNLTVAGNYILKWTSKNAPCADSESTVTITRVTSPTVSFAGNPQSVCQTVASVTLAGNTPLVGSGLWTVAAPGGATVTFSNNTSPTANATGLTVAGVYTFTWTISNAPCLPNSTSTVQVTVTAPPTVSNAGIAQTICADNTVLAATAVTVGQGSWSTVSVPSGAGTLTFSDINSATASVSNLTVAGNYILKWTSKNAPCADSESTVTISRVASPTVSFAGANQTVCATSYVLNGNTPAVGTGTWSVVAPAGATVTFSSNTNPTATANGLTVNGVYTFTWTIANAPCLPNSASTVDITVNAPPTVATVGATQDICGATTTLTGNNPAIGTGTWTVIAGGATVDFPTQFNSTVSGLTPGINRFRWTITNGTCASSSADLLVNSFATPSTANAGSNALACAADGFLNAVAPTAGTGTWTRISGSGAIISPNSPTTQVTGLGLGANVFRWTVTNGVCPAAGNFSDVTLTRRGAVSLSVAGISETICGATYNLNANLPNAAAGEIGTWSVIGGATIAPADINNPTAVATNLAVGFNLFTWTVTNGCATSVSSIVITRNDNVTPSNAGIDQTVCATTAQLSGNAPTAGTGAWTVVSGSGVFVSANQFNTQVNGLGAGANTFRWTITNGAACTPSFDDVVITSQVPPSVAVAGINQTVCADNTFLTATPPAVGTGAWTRISGTGSVVNPTLPNSQVINLAEGANVFRWTTSNGTCPTSFNDVIITRQVLPSTSFAGADQLTCNMTYTLAANTPTVGTGVWTVTAGTGMVTTPSAPNSTVTNLSPGVNTFMWTVTNGTCPPSVSSVNITRTDPATVATVGANQVTCLATATLTGNTAAIGAGVWTVTAGTASVTNPTNPTSGVTGLTDGINTFRWRISNACGFTDAFLTITRQTTPTVASVGTNQTTCNTFLNALSGNTALVGIGVWTVTAGTATVTDVNNPASGVTGLIDGINTFTWTISNACGTTSASVTITKTATPTVATVGTNQIVCSDAFPALSGNTAAVGIGVWAVTAGMASVTDPTSPTSGVTGLTSGINTFRWRISNACGFTDAFLTITRQEPPSIANAGTNQAICASSTTLNATNPVIGTGQWTLVTPPVGFVGMINFNNANFPNATVSGLTQAGDYTFAWTTSNGVCPTSSAQVTVSVLPLQFTANGGAAQNLCSVTTTNLTGNTVVGTTGAWTQVSGAAAILVNANTPNLTVNGLTTGSYTFRWTLTGGSCAPSTSDVIVRIAEPANAGADQNLCSVTTATLAGNTPVVGTGTWTQVSGATATINSINSPTSGITGLTTGTYTFRWTITGSPCGTTNDDVVINVVGNASAGVNQVICNTTNATLAATAPVIGTGTWTVSPNAGVTITTPTSPTSAVTGLSIGTIYTFTWTITGTPCVLTPQSMTVTVAPNANAGIDQALCNVTTATLAGNTPLGSTIGTWTQITGTSATITNASTPNTTVTGLVAGTYTFRWTFTGGGCATTSDDVIVTVTAPANAGIDQNLCGVGTTTLAAITPVTGVGTWSKISGPAGEMFADINSPTTNVTGLTNGTYIFQWQVTGGACPTTNDQMTILVSSPADAGIDVSVCSVTSINLSALAPTTGTGAWSQIIGPSTATFSGNVFNATASNLQTGTYTFRWTISGSACTPSFDDVIVRVSENANAGADQAVCNVTSATLAGNIAVTGIGTWTQISGNPATITNPTSPTSTVTGLITGSYTFQWTFSGGICGNSNDQVVINVSAPTSAGANQSLCAATFTTLSATAPVAGTGLWTQVLGPGIASISNTGIINPTVSGLVAGTYVFRWTITGVACPNLFSEVTIVNSAVPNAGANQTLCLGSPLILQANTPIVGTGQWSLVSGASTATFANPNSPTSSVSNLTVGTYIFRWTVTGATCSQNTSDVTMTVIGVTPTNASAVVSDSEYCDNQIPPSATVTVGTTQNGARYELRRADNSLVASQVSAGNSLTFTITPAPTSTTTYTVVAIPNTGAISCSAVELADKGIVTVKVCEKQSIGLAKTVLPLVVQPNGSVNVTYLLTVRNLGNTELTNIQINDDLTTVFPAPATYSIVSPPSASGGLLANTGYTGTAANPNVLTGLGRLSAGETQTVSFTLNLIPNALTGNYINSAVARGERGSVVVTDRSTDGVNVDPDNDGDPRENTPTPFTLPTNLSRPRIGVAKNLFTTARQANGSYNITYQMTVRNYGNVELTNIQIIDDLAATFPSPAQFSLVGTPSATGSLTANASYTGLGANNVLVNGGKLAVGESQTVVLTVNLIPNTTNATYRNTATASGDNGTNRVTDNSTDGISPDPNGDGDPREESPTPFVLLADNNNSGRPLLGVAKSLTAVARQTDGSYNVTYSISLRNYGNVALSNLQVSDDLTATFPAPAVFRVVGAPSATGSLTANSAFTGTGSSANLLNGGTLAIGETQTITFSVNLTPNAAVAFYRNTAVGSGENGTNRVTDSSTDGLNPDPNGDGNPDENIPTLFSIPADRPQIGVAKNLLSAVRQANGSFNLTYLVTLRNYGNIALANVQVTDNLTNTFPSPAQFSVTTPPLATGNLVGNTGFTGTGANINLLSGGSLGIGERQSITFTVNMTPNASTGSFRNTAIGRGEGGGVPTTDTSTDGLNPDPDNNGTPNEESPTIFNLPTDNNNNNNRPLIGVAKNLLTPVRQTDGSYNFTYQINVRNYGNAEITNIQVIDDLTATFPSPATFRVISAPTSIGNLTTNSNYTGRAGNNNLLNGSGRLGIGESQTITFTVNVIPNANGATYRNTAIGTGTANGIPITDSSSEGSNPDPNGDGNPSEDVPTTFVLQPETVVTPIPTRFSFTTDNCSSTILTEKIILQNSGLVKITLLPNTVTPLRGVVSISTDGTMIYRPALNAVGLDSLEYEICNSINVCARGKIYINVLACTSQPPVIRPDVFGTDNCTEVKGNVLTNDTDPNGTVLKAKVVTNRLTVSGGVYSIAADGTFSYLPPKGFVGRDSMTYEACNSVPTLSKCGAAKIYVDVLDCQETFIPEGFSPNGDGINDVFTIKGAERFDTKVQIFNRWGNLIYEDEHYKNTWNAIATVGILVGEGVPDGTYYYIVDFRNGQKPKVGFLTVQR